MRYHKALAVVLAALAIGCGDDRVAPRKLGATYSSVGYLTSCAVTSPLSGACTSGSPLAISAATANAAGTLAAADFSKLATVAAGAPILVTVQSASVNLLNAATINIPVTDLGGGLKFNVVALRMKMESQTGTGATVSMAYDLLANGGTWAGSVTVSPASSVGLTNPRPTSINLSVQQQPEIDPSIANAFQFRINTPLSGGTLSALQGRIVATGYYQ